MTTRKKRILRLIPALLALVGLATLVLYQWLFADLPALEDLRAYTSAPSSKIYDRHGRLLYEMPPPFTGSHSPVPLAAIPDALRWATIATEDASFYDNPGMDAWAILRAAWINIQGGEVLAGGSTITQQLVRTVMFAPDAYLERTPRRKLRELLLAVRLTRHYSKDEILALYFNETYYGNMAYGAAAAAQAYFGKSVRDLDLAECALLAGLPQAPALYNPLEHADAARKRQAVVLDLMVKQGYTSAANAELAKNEALAFAAIPFPIRAPHFVMYVRGILEQELGLERLQAGGLHIYTTLDVDVNETIRDVLRHHLGLLAMCHYADACPPGGHNVRNGAVVALDPRTGAIIAMLGSPDYFAASIAGAVNGTTALRQPGSAIKPLTYAAAFDPHAHFPGGPFTAATMMLDVRSAFVTREGIPYIPLNYDLDFRGPVRLREALAASYNLVAVKVLDSIGVASLADLARQMGITTFDDAEHWGLALTLGGGEVRLLELSAAYAAFANGGRRVSPYAIARVADSAGNVLWQSPCVAATGGDVPNCVGARVVDARVAYLITDVLSDDLARSATFGEGSVLNLAGRPAAVKTGTTTNFRDNWTVGYTPELVVGVWVGNADNETMQDVTGVMGAAPVWHDIMEAAHKGRPIRTFSQPRGLVEMEVCALSGQLPNAECPHRVTELFIVGTEPHATCDIHQRIDDTVYTILPSEAHAWAREHNIPQPGDAAQVSALRITQPDQGAHYRIDPTQPRAEQRIAVTVETDLALQSLTVLVNSAAWVTLREAPYTLFWPLQAGAHTFSAQGLRADGEIINSNHVDIVVVE